MPNLDVAAIVEPLVAHKAFPSAEAAARELVRDFILRQIDLYRSRILALERFPL